MSIKVNPGDQFGRLTAVERVQSKSGHQRWLFACECGKRIEVFVSNTKTGNTQSCGCLNRERIRECKTKHGFTHTRLYQALNDMIQRCYNPRNTHYKDYGGRGISVCEEWRNNRATFFSWALKHGYQDNLQIDRIDTNGNYTPNNCRFVTCQENQNNKRNNHKLELDGVTHSVLEWASLTEIKMNTLWTRINRQWSVRDALTSPVGQKRPNATELPKAA